MGQITRRNLMKGCLMAAAAVGSVSTAAQAAVPAPTTKVYDAIILVAGTAGGLFFRDYIGGSQLGSATVFGRIAVRHIAKAWKKA